MIHPQVGLAIQPDLWQTSSLRYRLARSRELEMEEAEEHRLLYVALTRAQEKVLISGYARQSQKGVRAAGWLGQLLEVSGVETDSMTPGTSEYDLFNLIVVDEYPDFLPLPDQTMVSQEWGDTKPPLFAPLSTDLRETTDEGFDETPARAWRASGRRRPPASVVGVLVHRAIERWLFPPERALDRFLRISAMGEGLIEQAAQEAALALANDLLSRLRAHPLWQEISESDERLHEVPYTYQPDDGPPDSGAIDLLFQGRHGWRLLDFKTDEIRDESRLQAAVLQHSRQLARYKKAAERLLDAPVLAQLVFLDALGQIRIVEGPS
jgi:ATP-dependent exoDNAse (exonuclease V) beta subunit